MSAPVVGHDAGRADVDPITYAYHDGAVYGHSTEGQKLHMMRADPYVCFEVEQIDDLANWRSVIAWVSSRNSPAKMGSTRSSCSSTGSCRYCRAPPRTRRSVRTIPNGPRTTRPIEHPSCTGSS